MVDVKEIGDVHIDINEEETSTYIDLTGIVEVDPKEADAFLEDLEDLIHEYQLT